MRAASNWPVDLRLVNNEQSFASVTIRGCPLVVRLSADPAKSSRRRSSHLPTERRMAGDRRTPALRKRPTLLVTVAVGCRPPGHAWAGHVILQVAGAESSTEEVHPRRDVVAKAWVRNFGGLSVAIRCGSDQQILHESRSNKRMAILTDSLSSYTAPTQFQIVQRLIRVETN